MKLPSLAELPILRMTPSLTATTGEPFLAKMLIPRRVGEEEMTSAALPVIRVSVVEFFSACAGGEFVGVAGVGGDREVGALGEAGQRADQGRRGCDRRRGRR